MDSTKASSPQSKLKSILPTVISQSPPPPSRSALFLQPQARASPKGPHTILSSFRTSISISGIQEQEPVLLGLCASLGTWSQFQQFCRELKLFLYTHNIEIPWLLPA